MKRAKTKPIENPVKKEIADIQKENLSVSDAMKKLAKAVQKKKIDKK